MRKQWNRAHTDLAARKTKNNECPREALIMDCSFFFGWGGGSHSSNVILCVYDLCLYKFCVLCPPVTDEDLWYPRLYNSHQAHSNTLYNVLVNPKTRTLSPKRQFSPWHDNSSLIHTWRTFKPNRGKLPDWIIWIWRVQLMQLHFMLLKAIKINTPVFSQCIHSSGPPSGQSAGKITKRIEFYF